MKKLILLFVVLIMSCEEDYKIEKGDYVEKCVITKVKVRKPLSTIDFAVRYVYLTDCGTRHVTTKPVYKIGDTLTFVYKKLNKQ